MPLYEYRCGQGCRFERLARAGDSTSPCPHGTARRAISANARPPSLVKSGSEFRWTPDALDAHEQAMGWKREALEIAEREGLTQQTAR